MIDPLQVAADLTALLTETPCVYVAETGGLEPLTVEEAYLLVPALTAYVVRALTERTHRP